MWKEMNFINDLTLDMQTVMTNHLKGKRFVYRTKYGGETFGIIAQVIVSKAITWDPDTQTNFDNILSHVKNHSKDPRPEPIPVRNYYSAYVPNIMIQSTNGITYRLDENNIFILND